MKKNHILLFYFIKKQQQMQQNKSITNTLNRVGFEDRHGLFFTIVLILLSSFNSFAQSTAEILKQPDLKKQLNYIIDNIYEIRTANLDTGLYYINYATELAQRIDEPELEAKAYKEKGIIHYYTGNFEQELISFQLALNIAERIDDKGLQGNIFGRNGFAF